MGDGSCWTKNGGKPKGQTSGRFALVASEFSVALGKRRGKPKFMLDSSCSDHTGHEVRALVIPSLDQHGSIRGVLAASKLGVLEPN